MTFCLVHQASHFELDLADSDRLTSAWRCIHFEQEMLETSSAVDSLLFRLPQTRDRTNNNLHRLKKSAATAIYSNSRRSFENKQNPLPLFPRLEMFLKLSVWKI